jgi:acetoin utilization deacetylase AcuC-like enzyme
MMESTQIAFTTVRSPEHNLQGHPENSSRFTHFDQLTNLPFSDKLVQIETQMPHESDLLEIHPSEYLTALQEAVKLGPGFLDYGDTYITQDSYLAANLATGGVLNVLDSILNHQVRAGFAMVRPPGHHATRTRAMGFCLLNNIAIGAKYAQRHGLKKILIVDFDVHHGNGTQDIFESDPDICFLSSHQAGIFPGTGHLHEIGTGEGEGTVVNVPLPPRAGDQALIHVYDEILTPLAYRFQPEMIMISAGFDAHWSDPLASLLLTKGGYYELAHRLCSLANSLCEGRILFVLEGGYDPSTLIDCIEAVLTALVGNPPGTYAEDTAPYSEVTIDALIDRVREVHRL